jgi:hypothetical protein
VKALEPDAILPPATPAVPLPSGLHKAVLDLLATAPPDAAGMGRVRLATWVGDVLDVEDYERARVTVYVEAWLRERGRDRG